MEKRFWTFKTQRQAIVAVWRPMPHNNGQVMRKGRDPRPYEFHDRDGNSVVTVGSLESLGRRFTQRADSSTLPDIFCGYE